MRGKTTALAILAALLTGCSGHGGHAVTEKHPLVEARTASVREIEVPRYSITSGTVASDHRVMISSRLTGYIRAVRVREGERVHKNDLLIRIDPVDARQALAQALADLADARADFRRFKSLLAQKAVSRQQFDKVAMRYKIARARVARARNQLSYAEIRSPVDGIVVRKMAHAGDLAKPGAPLLSIEDPRLLLVETDASEQVVSFLHHDAPVDLSIPAIGEVRRGHIRQLVSAANPVSHKFHIKISLDNPAGIHPGMFVEVRFRIGRRRAIVVPAAAIVHRYGLTGVYVVDRKGIVHYRLVRLGPAGDGDVEVAAGLHAGERVAWGAGLHTGVRVRKP